MWPAGNEPVVNTAVFGARDNVVVELELDAVEVVEVTVLLAPCLCCGRGQIRILGLPLSNWRTESGSALNGGKINRMLLVAVCAGGCVATAAGADGTGVLSTGT